MAVDFAADVGQSPFFWRAPVSIRVSRATMEPDVLVDQPTASVHSSNADGTWLLCAN
jgi:hypothetical protein